MEEEYLECRNHVGNVPFLRFAVYPVLDDCSVTQEPQVPEFYP
jgi:hypothetical protein